MTTPNQTDDDLLDGLDFDNADLAPLPSNEDLLFMEVADVTAVIDALVDAHSPNEESVNRWAQAHLDAALSDPSLTVSNTEALLAMLNIVAQALTAEVSK